MSKLIVDMPIPLDCSECRVSVQTLSDGWYYCMMKRSDVECGLGRPEECPIKGVLPEEHGDLIDRSLLCADLAGVILSHSGLGVAEVIARKNAVIAAERKDDEQIH